MLNCKRELDMNPLVSTAVAWVRPATKYAHLAAIRHALILSAPNPCRNAARKGAASAVPKNSSRFSRASSFVSQSRKRKAGNGQITPPSLLNCLSRHYVRGVAQSGSAPGSGPGGRRFKSSRPDHLKSMRCDDFLNSENRRCRRFCSGESLQLLQASVREARFWHYPSTSI